MQHASNGFSSIPSSISNGNHIACQQDAALHARHNWERGYHDKGEVLIRPGRDASKGHSFAFVAPDIISSG